MHTPPSAPEKFVLIVVLAIGLVAGLATPISAGYDEETHFIRAWEMAHLHLVPNEQLGAKLPFPALYWDLSYRRKPLVEAVEPGFWRSYGALPIDASDYVYANVETRSVYSPLLLLPQAVTLRYLGLSLQLPALVVYYACRLAGLLSYLLLTWLAVRFIPYGKWLLAILAVSPMALFQASTISADTISNGIAFLFIGATLAIANRQPVGWKGWVLQLGLVALLLTGKVNLIYLMLLPFLLIPPSGFRMKYGFVLLATGALVLVLIEVIGWNTIAYSQFTRALEGADPRLQLEFILADPLRFVGVIAQDIWTNTPAYLRGWVGVYGYNYWPVPALTYLLYPVAVAAALLIERDDAAPGKRTRWILAALFALGFVLTIVSLYVAFTPARSLYVAGVQGRYFTVVMPLLFLSLGGLGGRRLIRGAASWARQNRRALTSAAVGSSMATLVLFTAGLLLSYHVPCGSEYYRWSLCNQPQYKNWAPESVSSPPISTKLTLTQEIVPACDGMTELRIWVNSNGADKGGATTLLLRSPSREAVLEDAVYQNLSITERGWLTVKFPPEWDSDGQLYVLRLSGSNEGGIRVGYSEKPEYLEGKLYENQNPKAQDLLFQYGCISGLQRLAGVGR